jgi:hypothetical protein
MSGRTEVERRRLGRIEVIDDHVEVHLLGLLLSRPVRRRVTVHPVEGIAPAVPGAGRARSAETSTSQSSSAP